MSEPTTTAAPPYELLYDAHGLFIGLREHQTTHSPAGLAALAGRLRQAEGQAIELAVATAAIVVERDALARALKICRADRSTLAQLVATAKASGRPTTTTTPAQLAAPALAFLAETSHLPRCASVAHGGACDCGLAVLRGDSTVT